MKTTNKNTKLFVPLFAGAALLAAATPASAERKPARALAVSKTAAVASVKAGIKGYQRTLDPADAAQVERMLNGILRAQNPRVAKDRARILLRNHPSVGRVVAQVGDNFPGAFKARPSTGSGGDQPEECKGQVWPNYSDECINAIVIAICKAGGGGDTCGD